MALRRVKPGQRPQVGDINQFVRRFEEMEREVKLLTRSRLQSAEPVIRVYAVNKTGQDLCQGDAAAFNGSPYETIQRMQTNGVVARLDAFNGGSSGPDTRPWVVAENLIRENEGGWCYLSGLCMARATGTGDYAAAPAAGGVVLERGTSGAPVIQECAETAEGGGEKWCLIRLVANPAAGADVVDQAQVITAQTAAAGVATTAPRSDGKMGLPIFGGAANRTFSAADLATLAAMAVDLGMLEFVFDDSTPPVPKGLRLRVNQAAGAAAYAATGGETNPTLRTTGDKGLDVLLAVLASGYDDNAARAHLLSTAAVAMQTDRGGLLLPLSSAATVGCLKGSAGGLYLNKGDGLTIAANVLKVLLAANPGLEFDSGGLRLKLGAAGDILYCDGSKWLSLVKDAGKYLKSGASAVSWDTPAATLNQVSAHLDSNLDLNDQNWNTVLSFTAPGSGLVAVWFNYGTSQPQYTSAYGQILDDGALCASASQNSDGGSPQHSWGSCFALVAGGSVVTFQVRIASLGTPRTVLAAETWAAGLALT